MNRTDLYSTAGMPPFGTIHHYLLELLIAVPSDVDFDGWKCLIMSANRSGTFPYNLKKNHNIVQPDRSQVHLDTTLQDSASSAPFLEGNI